MLCCAFCLRICAGCPYGADAVHEPWHIELLRLRDVWSAFGTRGESAKIAILDSGVTQVDGLRHVRLMDADGDEMHGEDSDTSPEGHGTQTASLVAAQCSSLEGVARDCECCSFAIGDSDGQPIWSLAGRALAAAVRMGVDLICCPFTFPTEPETSTAYEQFQQGLAAAREAGVPVIVSSGNDPAASPVFPTQDDAVVTVGGVDEDGELVSTLRWESWMTVTAPAKAVRTLTGRGTVSDDFSGTSAAAPIVAGIAALGVSLARAESEHAARLVRRELESLLRESASQSSCRLVNPQKFLAAVAARIN